MAMEDGISLSGVTDAALYGRQGQDASLLGTALYELKMEKRRCLFWYVAQSAKFYPDYVVITQT